MSINPQRKRRWRDALLPVGLLIVAVLASYGAYVEISSSIEESRARRAESDRRYLEALRSLDEIGRSMESMAETTTQLLETEIERLEQEVDQLEVRERALREARDRLERESAGKGKR